MIIFIINFFLINYSMRFYGIRLFIRIVSKISINKSLLSRGRSVNGRFCRYIGGNVIKNMSINNGNASR